MMEDRDKIIKLELENRELRDKIKQLERQIDQLELELDLSDISPKRHKMRWDDD